MKFPGAQVAAAVVQLIDRAVIRMAGWHLERRLAGEGCLAGDQSTVVAPEFFGPVKPPQAVDFHGRHGFACDSPLAGVAPESRRIYGSFYRCGDNWRGRPVVIMLHGWNGEKSCRLLFPLLAHRCRQNGISLLAFQLPCHGQRRAPAGLGNDFISPDLSAMLRSTGQALADTRALIGWLQQEGCGPVGIWGISLGAWLAGLLACRDERLAFAVLMTPIVRMDRAIAELQFCAPIRRSLAGGEVPFAGLNLTDHRPLIPRHNLLLVEGRHDLFAPRARVEELWEAWDRPPIERFAHGHISMMFSPQAMMGALRFVQLRAHTADMAAPALL